MKWLLFHIILISCVQTAGANVFSPAEPDTVTIRITGSMENSRFEPRSVTVEPETVLRFEVTEGVHTVTAYHPDNRRKLDIPGQADSFDSGMLTSGDTWHLKLSMEGEYNYFCRPHERMGHTGVINVKSIAGKPNLINPD